METAEPNPFLVITVGRGDIEVLTRLWYDSFYEKDGEETRNYILDHLEEIAAVNGLHKPFSSSCHESGQEFTSFRQVVEAYDARYLANANHEKILAYLKQTKGTYVPALLLRTLCAYNPKEDAKFLADVLLQVLLRLSKNYALLQELWSAFLKKIPKDEIELWEEVFDRVAGNIETEMEHLSGLTYIKGNKWTGSTPPENVPALEEWYDFIAQLLSLPNNSGGYFIPPFYPWSALPILKYFFNKYMQSVEQFDKAYSRLSAVLRNITANGFLDITRYVLENKPINTETILPVLVDAVLRGYLRKKISIENIEELSADGQFLTSFSQVLSSRLKAVPKTSYIYPKLMALQKFVTKLLA